MSRWHGEVFDWSNRRGSLSGCDKGCKGLVSPTVTRDDKFSEALGNPTGDRR